MRKFVAVFILFCLASISVAMAADEGLRVIRGLVPGQKGNPYSNGTNIAWDVYAAIFDTLTRVLNTGELVPWVAETWEQRSDGTWTFTIKPGLAFSNSEPLDAAAVAAAIAYLKGDGAREPASVVVRGITKATARDPRTVEIVTAVRDPLLPQRLSALWIVAPGVWKQLGRDGFASAPVGSGPYRVERWAPQEIRLTRATQSWRKGPSTALAIRSVADPAARNAALIAGQADIAIGSTELQFIPTVEAAGGSVYVDQLPAVIAVAFNNVKDPRFSDVRLRQALNYAVDKEQIARMMLEGRSKIATQIGRTGFFGFNDAIKPYPFDPARARALLKEAGYPNGLKFEMELAAGATLWDAIFLQVANDLRKVGVDMTIRMVQGETIVRSQQTGQWPTSAWGAAYFSASFDALEPLRQHSCLWQAPWFCDRVIADAVAAAAALPDLDARRAATERVMALASERAQALFVYESVGFIALGPRVKRFRSDFGFTRYELIELAP